MSKATKITISQPKPTFIKFLEQLKIHGEDPNALFTSKEEFVNKTYSERWNLSNSSTRGKTTSLVRLYDLELDYNDTLLLLNVFKYWARTAAPGTTDSRMGIICNLICKYEFKIISDIFFLKSIYGELTTSHKKNINTLFLVLHDTFLKEEYKSQRYWAKDNLDIEKINPHDPVNGAYSDDEFNIHLDRAMANIAVERNGWLTRKSATSFRIYSNAIFHLLSLISSRRPAQLGQCKICDLSMYAEDNDDVQVDNELIEIIFHKSKIKNAGFRGQHEGTPFPFSEVFSSFILAYLADYKSELESICKSFDVNFKELQWSSYPLFPDFSSIKYQEDLKLPNMHSDFLHRTLGHSSKNYSYAITRIRHSTITRGMELGMNDAELARLTGVTTAAVKNYKDLTPKSRQLINQRFSKNNLLCKSFNWTLEEFNEHFGMVHTDEFGHNLGGIKKEVGCSTCTKKSGAPLGCYSCGAGLFIPFWEGDHESQLIKAKAKKNFLESTGANHHQKFEISIIIKRIEQVIVLQKNHNNKTLDS